MNLLDLLQPQAQDVAGHADREWAGERGAQLGRAVAGEAVEQVVHPAGDGFGELPVDGRALERSGERTPVARVLVAVDDEHLAAEHHALRVVADVDDEALGVHLELVEQPAAGHQPGTVLGKPGDGLMLTQAVQHRRVVVALQLVQGEGGAQREAIRDRQEMEDGLDLPVDGEDPELEAALAEIEDEEPPEETEETF